MRRLMWFVVGFALSIGPCSHGLPENRMFPLGVGAAAAAAVCAFAGKKWKPAQKAAVVFLGCAIGTAWFWVFQTVSLRPAAALDGQEIQVMLTASDYGYDTDYGTAFDAAMETEGKTYRVRAYLKEKKTIEPGDKVTGLFRFRFTAAMGQEESSHHPGKGIFLLAYQEETVELAEAAKPEWKYYPAILTEKIKAILEAVYPSDSAPFAKALLLGDTADIDYETDTDLKLSGIRHVAAVSGLHVSILFALLSIVTFRRRFLTALLGFPALLLFAAMAGFTPSVTRACIMSALMLLAQLLDQEYDGATALAFAVLVMLAVNPLVITSVSFQLSVSSAAGIFLFQPGIYGWMQEKFSDHKAWYARWATGSVSVSLSAMTLTAPLCAYHFGTVSLIGPVTNLLSLWAISFVFYGIMANCLVSLFWGTGSAILAKGISAVIRCVLQTSKILAGLPLAAVYTRSVYIIGWLVFCYVLLVVFLFSKKRRPVLLGCCAAIGLCIALLASWAEPLTDGCRMTVLDVGQGQSILLQSGGRTYLVDCGGDSDAKTADMVAETLLSQGIDHLDGMILTHFDGDHAGAAENLLTRIGADVILVPDIAGAEAFSPNGRTVYLDRDAVISWADAKLTVYGPIFSGDSNENSLCVLFETQNCAILITGDRSAFGERQLMRKHKLPDVDVLIAGHHGSGDSTSDELLRAVRPEVVMISVGENPYGHPSRDLLERLEKFGCEVYRTDIHGTIYYRR